MEITEKRVNIYVYIMLYINIYCVNISKPQRPELLKTKLIHADKTEEITVLHEIGGV